MNPLSKHGEGDAALPGEVLHFERLHPFYDDQVVPQWDSDTVPRDMAAFLRDLTAHPPMQQQQRKAKALALVPQEELEEEQGEPFVRPPFVHGDRSPKMHFLKHDTLIKYTNAGTGKILRRRKTGLSPKEQRKMSKLVKRARHMGVLKVKPDVETFLRNLRQEVASRDEHGNPTWQRNRGRLRGGGGSGNGGRPVRGGSFFPQRFASTSASGSSEPSN